MFKRKIFVYMWISREEKTRSRTEVIVTTANLTILIVFATDVNEPTYNRGWNNIMIKRYYYTIEHMLGGIGQRFLTANTVSEVHH